MFRKSIRFLRLAAVLLVSALMSVNLPSGILPVAQAAGTITGSAFRDFNANGVFDGNEVGQSGVTVTAYDAANSPQGTTTTSANGTYALNATGTGPYRIQFTGWPSYLQPAATGTSNATSVQFVPDGNSSNVNFGLNDPNEYSQPNPLMVTPQQINGQAAGDTTNAGLVSFDYNASGVCLAGNVCPSGLHNTVATVADVGSTWGVAWQATQQRMYVSAMMKRHADFADDPAEVYVFTKSGNTINAAFSKFSLQGVAPANGGATIDLGSVCRQSGTDGDPNPNCLPSGGAASDYTLGAPNTANIDFDAFDKVGKISYGDADMSEDGKTLWLVNLNQNGLISVDATGALPGTVNQYPLSSMGLVNDTYCTVGSGQLRPWALKFYHGKGYLGAICTAETSLNRNDLKAYVFSFDPANPAVGVATALSFPLAYTKQYQPAARGWEAWISNWNQYQTGAGVNPTPYQTDANLYTQPILADIEFDDNGSMILSFMDRFGHQGGQANHPAILGAGALTETVFGSGDIVEACNVNGSLVLEGSAASCPVQANQNNNTVSPGVSGNGEYYNDQRSDLVGDGSAGGLALLHGSGEVAQVFIDPQPAGGGFLPRYQNSQGIEWFPTAGGLQTDALWINGNGFSAQLPFFNKANGLGDLELLSDAAPVEIGNRVWIDSNHNGIQDAGETPANGVTVHLYAPDGITLLESAITNAAGDYYFSDATGTSTASARYGITALTTNTTGFQIRLDNPADYALGGPLYQYDLTTPNIQTGDTDLSGDVADSDGTLATPAAPIGTGNFPTKSFNVGAAGFNNHTFDFGFFQAAPTITMRKLVNGADANNPNGTDVPVITPGQLATWTYVVTNTGTVSIPRTDINVTDDVVGNLMTNGVLQTLATPYTSPVFGAVDQLSPDNVLAPGEVFQLVVTWIVPDFSAQSPNASSTDQWVLGCANGSTIPTNQRVAYENTGTVTIPSMTVSDDAHLCNPTPTITMRKLVNGADANNPNGTDVPVITPGQLATWTYVVTNTGTVSIPRTDINVTDDVVGNLMTNGVLQTLATPYTSPVFGAVDQLSPDNVLAPGEVFQLVVTWIVPDFSAQDPNALSTDQWVLGCANGSTIPTDQRVAYENTGTVTIPSMTVSDDAHLCNPTPTITMRKLVNGADANNPNGTDVPVITPGQLATWTYVVTNTGTVSIPRTDINVTDDVVGNLMTNGVLQTLATPYTSPVFGAVDQLSPDNVLAPGEVFQLVVTWIVPDFSAQSPNASSTDQWVLGCANGSTIPTNQRVAYENTGTVTIPSMTVSDDAHLCNPTPPTAVTLTNFSTVWQNGALTVLWTTSSEINTWGFHLLRSTDGNQVNAVRVSSLILSEGRGHAGASYTWRDTTAKLGVTYTYWLEETETDGSTHVYGPANASQATAVSAHTIFLPTILKR